eukprot:130515-Alexandrium_andersonii.AAC.1
MQISGLPIELPEASPLRDDKQEYLSKLVRAVRAIVEEQGKVAIVVGLARQDAKTLMLCLIAPWNSSGPSVPRVGLADDKDAHENQCWMQTVLRQSIDGGSQSSSQLQ